MSSCCKLVGNLEVSGGCFISISTSCSTDDPDSNDDEYDICTTSDLQQPAGSTTQTVTVTGYASEKLYTGCGGKAGVSTSLTRKYDYGSNSMRFSCDGHGSSYVSGDVDGLASVLTRAITTPTFNASSESGPASIYFEDTQISGRGLRYSGLPMSFSTSGSSCTSLSLSIGRISGSFYLQSFSLDLQPGRLPVASYTLTRIYYSG